MRYPKHVHINSTSFDSQVYQTHQCQNTHSLYHIMHFIFHMHSSLTHILHLFHKSSNNILAYTFITTNRYSNSQRHKPHSIITQLGHYTYFSSLTLFNSFSLSCMNIHPHTHYSSSNHYKIMQIIPTNIYQT